MTPNEFRNIADRLRDHVQDVDKLGYLARHLVMSNYDLDNDVHRIKEWMKDGANALQKAADIIEANAAHS